MAYDVLSGKRSRMTPLMPNNLVTAAHAGSRHDRSDEPLTRAYPKVVAQVGGGGGNCRVKMRQPDKVMR